MTEEWFSFLWKNTIFFLPGTGFKILWRIARLLVRRARFTEITVRMGSSIRACFFVKCCRTNDISPYKRKGDIFYENNTNDSWYYQYGATLFVIFQSFATGLGNTLAQTGEISGSSGVFLGLFMLVAGIIGVKARKSKAGAIVAFLCIGQIGWNLQYWHISRLNHLVHYILPICRLIPHYCNLSKN